MDLFVRSQQQKRASPHVPFSYLLESHLLIFFWSKQIIQQSPDSKVENVDSTSWWEKQQKGSHAVLREIVVILKLLPTGHCRN